MRTVRNSSRFGGCTWSGGCNWSWGVYLVPGGCTWSWGVYLVLGYLVWWGVPVPGWVCVPSGGSRIFQMGGHCFVANGGVHILFSGKKCMKLKEIGLKWGGAGLLAPCYSKITIFLWIILNSIMKTSYFTYLRIFWDILYKIIF